MDNEKYCESCQRAFDWPGVTADGQEYCCAACAEGDLCTCPDHEHDYDDLLALDAGPDQAASPIESPRW
jgi:hypothetical protein